MRILLLTCASLLALSAAGTVSAMPTTTFAYTGGFQSYTVPVTALYDILAFGGQGGSVIFYPNRGGYGAQIGGDFELTAGEILNIAVGGAGSSNYYSGGGGGGSFVVGPGNTPLVVAGGGGGAAFAGSAGQPSLVDDGSGGQTGIIGSSGDFIANQSGAGGVGGKGGAGAAGIGGAGGGAGFFGNGGNSFIFGSTTVTGYGGTSFPKLTGGASSDFGDVRGTGGFGGGGGGGFAGGGGGGAATAVAAAAHLPGATTLFQIAAAAAAVLTMVV